MRKALIAVAVATALFAVGAFAARSPSQSEDIASGSNEVASLRRRASMSTSMSPCCNRRLVDRRRRHRDVLGGDRCDWTCDEHDARLAVDSGGDIVHELGGEQPVDRQRGRPSRSLTRSMSLTSYGASVVVDGATLTADADRSPT